MELTREKLLQMYRQMMTIRYFDEGLLIGTGQGTGQAPPE
jgi:TPP-dependent pyruvate/acetoin dehydrogenase alpha subunit